MINILGSIDNAAIWDTQYYLIFTENEIFQFELMSGKEFRKDIFNKQMSNPYRMAPVAGQVSNYNITREDAEQIVNKNIATGKSIEQNLDSIISEDLPEYKFTPIRYNTIDKVELSNGTMIELPHLILHGKNEKIKFHLTRNNYQARGKLPDNIFSSYEETLKKAFGDMVDVKT